MTLMIPPRTAHDLQNFLQQLMFHTEDDQTETLKLLIRQLSLRISAITEPPVGPQLPDEHEYPDDTVVRALYRIFVVLEQIRASIGAPMPTHYEQTVEALLRQLLEQSKITNARLAVLVGFDVTLVQETQEIEAAIEKLIPEPAAVSATLELIPNR